MTKNLFLIPAIIVLLSACSGSDSDGVPAVDDPHNIIIKGEKIKQIDFVKKYCMDKPNNGTCSKVKIAAEQDAGKGDVPRF